MKFILQENKEEFEFKSDKKNFDIKFFLDDDKDLWNRTINGLKVFPLSKLNS